MSTTYAVTVTIGRNIPSRHRDAAREDGIAEASRLDLRHLQLNDQAWEDYTKHIEEALETYVDEIETTSWWFETHDGIGEWDGVSEESRKVTLLFETPNGLPQSARENLVLDLLRARTAYYNDAAALAFGESVLV